MRVLVTGSHGFIGSQLVLALKERGDEVYESDLKNGVPFYQVNARWGKPFDEIYHLACVNQEEAVGNPERNVLVNAYGAKLMAEIAVTSGARFVYTSTASVYGKANIIPTHSRYRPKPKSDYAVAKLAGEHFVKNSGADFTIFRLSNVYGPGQTTENPYCGVVAKFFEAAIAGKPLQIIGDGSQTRDFTYVGDVIPHLMNPELKGLLNCSHGDETSIASLAGQLVSICESGSDFHWAPERPVDGIQRRCLISDVTCPTDLQMGLQKTYNWLQSADVALSNDSGRKAPV
jgi:UDP-glucose 4-epimerase